MGYNSGHFDEVVAEQTRLRVEVVVVEAGRFEYWHVGGAAHFPKRRERRVAGLEPLGQVAQPHRLAVGRLHSGRPLAGREAREGGGARVGRVARAGVSRARHSDELAGLGGGPADLAPNQLGTLGKASASGDRRLAARERARWGPLTGACDGRARRRRPEGRHPGGKGGLLLAGARAGGRRRLLLAAAGDGCGRERARLCRGRGAELGRAQNCLTRSLIVLSIWQLVC